MRKLWICVLMEFLACDSPSQSPQGPKTYRDYLAANHQFLCETSRKCCASPKDKDVASCVQRLDASQEILTAGIEQLIGRGSLTYSSVEAQHCIQAFKDEYTTCELPLDLSKIKFSCAKIISGTLATGATCKAGETVCSYSDDCKYDQTGVTGICAPKKRNVGDDCNQAGCASDLGLVCLSAKKCGYPLDAGQSCDQISDAPGAQCKSNSCDTLTNKCVNVTARQILFCM